MTRTEACNKLHQTAKLELGVHETPGAGATSRIVTFGSYTSLKATSDEVPWCSAFANAVMAMAGFKGTGSAAARSWLDWGKILLTPIVGCVVVFRRGDSATQGHVAFCDHADISNGIIRVIGGNQGDSVKVACFPVSSVLGYRSPL